MLVSAVACGVCIPAHRGRCVAPRERSKAKLSALTP